MSSVNAVQALKAAFHWGAGEARGVCKSRCRPHGAYTPGLPRVRACSPAAPAGVEHLDGRPPVADRRRAFGAFGRGAPAAESPSADRTVCAAGGCAFIANR